MMRIGVRELRQHASRYLARVKAGETIEVTERGRPVAVLAPLPASPWDEMVARGQVQPASRPLGDLPPAVDYGVDASAVLAAMRDEDDR
jgi:prevent-host-death family protein